MAFEHQTKDSPGATADLARDISCHNGLAPVILSTVSVAAIHHQARWQPCLGQCIHTGTDTAHIVVRPVTCPAQDQMAMRIARRCDHHGAAIQ